MLKIAEIYESIQGEGVLTGTPSLFIRTSGCNLRCHFCDTPFTSWQPEGRLVPVASILAQARQTTVSHVVITGGEPMIWPSLCELTAGLAKVGKHITIETAGTLFLPVTCHLMSISPKFSNSTPHAIDHPTWHRLHDQRRHAPDVVRRLMDSYEFQLKFVLSDPTDVTELEAFLTEFSTIDRDRILLMPEGTTVERLREVADWLIPLCQARGYRFCPRKHIEWFGHQRGT